MKQRQLIEQQIRDLLEKATQRPGAQDDMGMVGFLASLVAAKMTIPLLQEDASTQDGKQALRETE